MKCNSCESEIDPKWKHAIENNICPFCGLVIMDSLLKDLLADARDILDELKEKFNDEFLEWAKHNYNLLHVEDIKNIKNAKILKEEGEMKSKVESEIFKRAEIKQKPKPEVTKDVKIKSAIDRIKNAGMSQDSDLNQITSLDLDDEDLEPATDSDLERAKDMINKSYGLSSDPDDDSIPDEVMNMARLSKSDTYNQKDVFMLQNMLSKTKESRDKVLNGGGGKGSFSKAG